MCECMSICVDMCMARMCMHVHMYVWGPDVGVNSLPYLLSQVTHAHPEPSAEAGCHTCLAFM